MIETRPPEFDLDNLMERVRRAASRRTGITGDAIVARFRAEAAKRHPGLLEEPATSPPAATTRASLPAVPVVDWWRTVDPKTGRLKELLQRGMRKNAGSKVLPKFLRGLFRGQGKVNSVLLESVRMLARTNDGLVKQVRELTAAFQAQTRWLDVLPADREENLREMKALAEQASQNLQTRAAGLSAQLEQDRRKTSVRLAALQESAGELAASFETFTAAHRDLRDAFRSLALKADATAQKVKQVESEGALIPGQLTATNARLDETAAHVNATFARMDERLTNDAIYIKAQLSHLTSVIEPTQTRPPKARRGGETTHSDEGTVSAQEMDAFYLAFENEFRGNRSAISERLKVYLPFLEAAHVSGREGGILDLGCGRGEWIELLQKHHFQNVAGVDLNLSMVEQCVGRGFAVVHEDAVAHLRAVAKNSLEAVTSFHLVEHLPVRVLLDLLRQIHRVLRPGGLAILETPNARNILVGASDFFRDLTHNRPLHPDTLRYTLQTVGFAEVRGYFLADAEDERSALPAADFAFDDLQSYVTVPRDYAVIARKG